MGLAVTGYERVEYMDNRSLDVPNPETDGFIDLAYIKGVPKRGDGMKPGWYLSIGGRYDVDNVSYHGYDAWRTLLGTMVGIEIDQLWKHPRPGPFVELLDFADNEGFFGPKTSAKLSEDFRAYRKEAVAFSRALGEDAARDWKGSDWLDLYDRYSKAFALAAGKGVVVFH